MWAAAAAADGCSGAPQHPTQSGGDEAVDLVGEPEEGCPGAAGAPRAAPNGAGPHAEEAVARRCLEVAGVLRMLHSVLLDGKLQPSSSTVQGQSKGGPQEGVSVAETAAAGRVPARLDSGVRQQQQQQQRDEGHGQAKQAGDPLPSLPGHGATLPAGGAGNGPGPVAEWGGSESWEYEGGAYDEEQDYYDEEEDYYYGEGGQGASSLLGSHNLSVQASCCRVSSMQPAPAARPVKPPTAHAENESIDNGFPYAALEAMAGTPGGWGSGMWGWDGGNLRAQKKLPAKGAKRFWCSSDACPPGATRCVSGW